MKKISLKEIKELIQKYKLEDINELKKFIELSKDKYSLSILSTIIELSNSKREKKFCLFYG